MPTDSSASRRSDAPPWVRSLERWGPLVLLLLFALDAGIRAATRPLWFDELISYYVARLPSLGAIWEALRQTADGQPPVTHLVMRASQTLFGAGELATRLPYLLGFALMSVFLFRTVRRRIGASLGLAAVCFAWLTWAYDYAYEARPYALLMGECGAAFYFWSNAAEGVRRRSSIALFALCLALMMSTHYYAGLLLIPFGVGEIVRALQNKRIDWPVWAVLGAAPFVLLLYLPLLEGVKDEYTQAFWSPVEWMDTYGSYVVLLAPAILPALASLIVAGVASRWDSAPPPESKQGRIGGIPRHEALAALALAATPLAYAAAAALLTGAYVYRYSLPAVFGVAVVFVMVVEDWLGRRPRAHAALFLSLLAGYLITRVSPTVLGTATTDTRAGLAAELAQVQNAASGDDPVVMAAPLNFLPYHLYAPEPLRSRLVYPTDIQAARKYGESDSAEVSIIKLARWAGYEAPSYDDWKGQDNYYLLVHKRARFTWLTKKLEEDRIALRLVSEDEELALYRCCGEAETASR